MMLGDARVLLLEDNLGDVQLFTAYLEEAEESQVQLRQAATLTGALTLVHEGPVDVALVDLDVPDSKGMQTFVELQKALPNVPVLVLTGRVDTTTGLEAVRLGAADYLVKNDLTPSLLVRSLLHAMERHRMANERKAAEEARRRSEETMQRMFEAAPFGLVIAALRDDVILFANAAWCDLLEVPIARVLGMKTSTFYCDVRDRSRLLMELRRSGVADRLEVRLKGANGRQRWVLLSARSVVYQGVVSVLVAHTDITERKRLEQAERDSRLLAEALRDSAAALNTSMDRDDLFDRILLNLAKVVDFETCELLLTNGTGNVEVLRVAGRDADESRRGRTHRALEVPGWQRMWSSGRPCNVPECRRSLSTTAHQSCMLGHHSCAGVPIVRRGSVIGMITIGRSDREPYGPDAVERLTAFAQEVALAIEHNRMIEQLQQLVVSDELTTLLNLRGLREVGQRELDRAKRFERPLCAVFLDVDHFRNINTVHGHQVGNDVLRAIGRACRAAVRAVDVVARFGGEEIVLLLVETKLDDARRVAERVRAQIESLVLTSSQGLVRVTASLGVAMYSAEMKSLTDLLERANEAERRAKKLGRNRVEVQPHTLPPRGRAPFLDSDAEP